MPRKKSLMSVAKNMYKGNTAKSVNGMHRPEGAGNFDNMDDYNIVNSIDIKTGTIQGTPTNAKDIVNKEYADGLTPATPTLQAVTDAGATTTNGITAGSFSTANDITTTNGDLYIDGTNKHLYIGENQEIDIYFGGTYSQFDSTGQWRLNNDILITNDNQGFWLGGEGDCVVYYDGTDMIFDSQQVGTGDFLFNNGDIQMPNDNQKLKFGAGQDASIFYDGTDMQINPREVGTGALNIGDNQGFDPYSGLNITSSKNEATVGRAAIYGWHASSFPSMRIIRSRGTPASRSAVQNGDGIGLFQFWGTSSSSAYEPAAAIGCYAEGNYTTSNAPASLRFYTTSTGASSYTERMRIKEDGTTEIYGDQVFVGAGTGLPYGACNGLEIAWVQAATSGTWYDISDATITACPLNLVTHSNGQLTLSKAGTYLISYGITLESAGAAGTHVACAISISGTESAYGQSHIEIAIANREMQMANSSIFTVTAGQTVNLSIQYTGAGTPNITVDDYSLSAVMIGG